jgi:hypothetical protein
LKRLLTGFVLLALAAGAQAQERRAEHGGMHGAPGAGLGQRGGYANPSAAITAEIALEQLARDKGQWTAFKATAAPDAVMFAPAMVLAQQWLKNQANPPVPLSWQPYQVWSSCDGSLMVTTGGWQRGDRHGWFTTVWERQEKGEYKWVFNHNNATSEPIAAPEMIAAKVADCPERRASDHLGGEHAGGPPGGMHHGGHGKPPKPEKTPPVPFDPTRREGKSRDGTLTWQVTADAAGTHDFSAKLMVDGHMQEIRKEHVTGG